MPTEHYPHLVYLSGRWEDTPPYCRTPLVVCAVKTPTEDVFEHEVNTGITIRLSDTLIDQPPLFQSDGAVLRGRMALLRVADQVEFSRTDSTAVLSVNRLVAEAVREAALPKLAEAVNQINTLQLEAGATALPSALHALAYKHVANGYGLYLFAEREHRDAFCTKSGALAVEPYYVQ